MPGNMWKFNTPRNPESTSADTGHYPESTSADTGTGSRVNLQTVQSQPALTENPRRTPERYKPLKQTAVCSHCTKRPRAVFTGRGDFTHHKKTNSFKKIKELRKLNPRLAKGTPNHPRGVYPLNHTADTPTCHCKHLPPSPQIPLDAP